MNHASIWHKRTTKLSIVCAALLLGIAFGRFVQPISGILPILAIVVTVALSRRSLTVFICCLVCSGFLVGWWRGGLYMAHVGMYKSLAGQKVTVMVTADSSGGYGQNAQLEFDAAHIRVLSPLSTKVAGRMVISGYGENSILRGDTIIAEGKLYQRRGGKQAGISYAKLQVVKRSGSAIEKVRREFLAGLATALPEPHDQFAAGLLVGQKSELSDEVTETLRIVGLSHVIAVSGYNLTIMADVARKKLGKKSKFRSTFFSILFVLAFVALAGSSASIARASFVSILAIVAAHYGRSIKPVLLLLLAAAFTAFINPFNLWADIGWYLSFLAFFGVLVVAPAVQARLYRPPHKPRTVTKIIIETSSAQIMTLPLTMYIFGQVSIISLFANVVIVPLVPIAMLLSLFAGFAGMTVPLASGFIAWPARVILDFMLSVAGLFARIPHAIENVSLTAVSMMAIYCLIIVVVIVLRQKTKQSATITE